jgi:acyl-[acyl carrier protein]--UDP-N-acetylglucosamine O-acyltransferase
MKKKKLTNIERIAALEKVVFQLFAMNKMVQDELKLIQDKIKENEAV